MKNLKFFSIHCCLILVPFLIRSCSAASKSLTDDPALDNESLNLQLKRTNFVLEETRRNMTEMMEELRALKLQQRQSESNEMTETLDSIRSMLMDVTVTLIQIQQKSQQNSDQIQSMQKLLKILQNSTTNTPPPLTLTNFPGSAFSTPPILSKNVTKSRVPIGDVISRPKARFYSGPDLTGDLEYFNPEGRQNPNCINLEKFPQKVQSIDLYGSCVRIYRDKFCYGHSIALYPKIKDPFTSSPASPSPWLPRVNVGADENSSKLWNIRSVGRCFENELDESEFQMSDQGVKEFRKIPIATGNGTKNDYQVQFGFLPDVAIIGYTGQHNKVTPPDSDSKPKMSASGPIYRYRTGYQGRVEFIHAGIRARDLTLSGQNNGSESQKLLDEKSFYKRMNPQSGDQMGHFLSPSKFRVQEQLPFFQIYPQSMKNAQMMEERENKILNHLRSTGEKTWLWITINVDYAGSNGTRPIGFSYRIGYDMLSFVATDVYLVN